MVGADEVTGCAQNLQQMVSLQQHELERFLTDIYRVLSATNNPLKDKVCLEATVMSRPAGSCYVYYMSGDIRLQKSVPRGDLC